MNPIYLDYNATTPIDPAVAEAMRPFLTGGLAGDFGNPSSSHLYGRRTHQADDAARDQVARILNCAAPEIVFTGSGSEADNLAIVGAAEAYRARGTHVITSVVEHPAVLNTCRYLERRGYQVTYLPVDARGQVQVSQIERAIRPETILITIMHANNETGTLQPIREIAAVARPRGILVHTDAAQSVGKLPTRVDDLGVDLLTVVGHKLYAPKGIGALFIRNGVLLEPLIHGAGHENGRRAGTENVPYIVALGKACEIALIGLLEEGARLRSQRDRLLQALFDRVPNLTQNGHARECLPNTLNLGFPDVDGEDLLAATPTVAASTGSACHAGRTEPSEVLLAMGLSRERALGAVRLSIGRFTTDADVDQAADDLATAWRSLTATK